MTTTLSLVFQAELTPDEITMLRVTLEDVVREVAKWTVGEVPFQIIAVGGSVEPEPGANVFDAGGPGLSFTFDGVKP